jgi:CheY-like chemotaxis protein
MIYIASVVRFQEFPIFKPVILVVDDKEDILELVRYNLAREGCEIITVRTGEEALHKAIEIRPDLPILDLMLPGIDGLEVLRRIVSDYHLRPSPGNLRLDGNVYDVNILGAADRLDLSHLPFAGTDALQNIATEEGVIGNERGFKDGGDGRIA